MPPLDNRRHRTAVTVASEPLTANSESSLAAARLGSPDYWEEIFSQEDPWNYGASDYEKWKFDLTLSLLPQRRVRRMIELGCAEGHLTTRLAPLAERILAVDISQTALRRARARCAEHPHIEFQRLDIANDPLPANGDLIVCSEILFYLPLPVLTQLAPRIARSLKLGGHLLLAHGNVVSDDKSRTGFDWDHPGAQAIAKIFGAVDELTFLRELHTPLFTIQLFRRSGAAKKAVAPEIVQVALPFDLELPVELERSIIWDGAVLTRAEARAGESASTVPILMYHSIADDGPPELAPYRVSPSAFREQLHYLRRHGYHSISLEDWAASVVAWRPVPGRPVIITFDDGYKDFVANALPTLERADFAATVFVVAEKVGGIADWDGLAEPLALMDWDDLRLLSSKGIAIGSHSAMHKDLSKLSAGDVRSEGDRALALLRERLGCETQAIAFPWGSSSEATRAVLAQCGYRIGLKSWGGLSTFDDEPMNLSRIEIDGADDIASFARKLAGAVPTAPLRDVRKQRPAPPTEPEGFADLPTNAGRDALRAHPDRAHRLSARFDALIGEFVKLQTELLNESQSPATLQKKLVGLFTLPVTGKVTRAVAPRQEIAPGVDISFDEGATVSIWVEPKADHSLSPATHLNALGLDFAGASQRLSLRVALDWRELALARRFQLSLYARPNRSVDCEATLRLPTRDGATREINFCAFTLRESERNAVASGALALPDFIELDITQKPHLMLCFDTGSDLAIELHYLNVYFA